MGEMKRDPPRVAPGRIGGGSQQSGGGNCRGAGGVWMSGPRVFPESPHEREEERDALRDPRRGSSVSPSHNRVGRPRPCGPSKCAEPPFRTARARRRQPRLTSLSLRQPLASANRTPESCVAGERRPAASRPGLGRGPSVVFTPVFTSSRPFGPGWASRRSALLDPLASRPGRGSPTGCARRRPPPHARARSSPGAPWAA